MPKYLFILIQLHCEMDVHFVSCAFILEILGNVFIEFENVMQTVLL